MDTCKVEKLTEDVYLRMVNAGIKFGRFGHLPLNMTTNLLELGVDLTGDTIVDSYGKVWFINLVEWELRNVK